MTDTTTPAPAAPAVPPAAAPAPASPSVVGGLVTALLTHDSDSLRRAGAALAALAVPFLNQLAQKYLAVSVPDAQVIAIEGVLGTYIVQSAAKAMHSNWLDSKSGTP